MPLGRCDVLDVGCQWGAWLAWCRQAWGHDGGRLCGIDLMREWIDKGKARYDFLDLRHGSGDRLPWDDETFDLVHQGMVFSSVLDADLREGIAAEMRRMVRPGGHVLWYDFFFNPINRDTVGMTYRRVKRYFPGWTTMARDRVTLAPPLSRVLGRIGPNAIDLLTSLRFLNFHYLILLRKPPA
jgi:ubiquinone/menaquinone biosynthesis C-methylase UbiE